MTGPEGSPLWLDEATAVGATLDAPPLSERLDADVCVVGGGFLGLWTAIAIKEREPGAEVVLVEGERCGSGASGRNGGFVMSWWSKFSTLAKQVGAEEALRLARASAQVPAEIAAFCERNDVDASLRNRGWLWVASSASQMGAWRGVVDQLDELGERPFAPLTPEEARERSGSPAVLGGVYEGTCAVVQPALLVAGLARVAHRMGVRIFERSRVTKLREADRPEVVTPQGGVVAGTVVLALGSWTAGHVRAVRRGLVVVASDMVATEPAADELDRCSVPAGVAISDSRLMVNYFHRTADDRLAFGTAGGSLAFGGRVGRRFTASADRSAAVEANLRRLYPALTARVSHGWTGPVDRSPSGIPFVVRRGRIVAAAGFSGNGVGPSKLVARILASLVVGADDEWARSGLVAEPRNGFPPEPVRYVGGLLVRRAVARKERAEDAGRRSGPATRRLAALAPAGLVPSSGEAGGDAR